MRAMAVSPMVSSVTPQSFHCCPHALSADLQPALCVHTAALHSAIVVSIASAPVIMLSQLLWVSW